MEIVVQTQKLTKYYHPSTMNEPVLKDLDFRMNAGKFTVFMGASGSGKSTLLHLLSGLDHPSSGHIKLSGEAISRYSETQLARFRRKYIGFVFQNHHLIEELTLEQNILLSGFLVNKNKKKVRQRAYQLMSQLEIGHLAQRLPGEISGGESQRAAIARALINDPKLVLADEPTGNLNSAASLSVMYCFQALHRQGASILMATHDVSSASFGDEIYYLKDGILLDYLNLDDIATGELKKKLILEWLQNNGW